MSSIAVFIEEEGLVSQWYALRSFTQLVANALLLGVANLGESHIFISQVPKAITWNLLFLKLLMALIN